jgi:Na+/melibiose symporter-like transporter
VTRQDEAVTTATALSPRLRVGYASGGIATERGTRRPFLLWGGIGLAVGFVLLFSGPVETLGLALGPAVFAAVLALSGYRSSTGDAVVQPASALTAITVGFSIVPAALVLLSLFALNGYRLTKQEVA